MNQSRRLIWTALFAFSAVLLFVLLNKEATQIKHAPEALRQWYKPENKRNVWQHNMFKLRREMQAIQIYGAEDNWALVKKWTNSFIEHYHKIPEMVPQWQNEIRVQASKDLFQASQAEDIKSVKKAMRSLRQSCNSCHRKFRSLAALQYRAADFSENKIVDEQGQTHSYSKYMEKLMFQLNAVVIANADQHYDDALESLSTLQAGVHQLGESCSSCHKTPEAREYYLGDKTALLLKTLEISLKNRKATEVSQNIGAFAVHACAKCHAVHRISADVKSYLFE